MTATDDGITLREYVDLAVKRVADSVTSLESRMIEINAQHNQSHAREHQMVELAVSKAEQAMQERLAGMNEFRNQLSDERGTYLTKPEFSRFEEGINREMDTVRQSLNAQANQWSNLQGKMAAFGAILIVISLVSMMVALWARLG